MPLKKVKLTECPKCKQIMGKDALHCSRCGSAIDIELAMKEEELQKTAVKSAVDRDYLARLVDAAVEERLKAKKSK